VTFTQTLLSSLKGMFPDVLIFSMLPMMPFIIAERIWPVGQAPRFKDYGANILISLSTAYLSLPLGIAAGLWSAQLRHALPWKPFSFTFHNIGTLPVVGPIEMRARNATTLLTEHLRPEAWRRSEVEHFARHERTEVILKCMIGETSRKS
jgi:hypothetical protein